MDDYVNAESSGSDEYAAPVVMHPANPIAPSAIASHANSSSLDTVFQLVREQYVLQQSNAAALDAKAGFILGSSSLLTAALTAYTIPPIQDSAFLESLIGNNVAAILSTLPGAAIVVFLIVVLTSYAAYAPFRIREVPEPNALVDIYLNKPDQETKEVLLATTLQAFNQNRRRLGAKAWFVRLAFVALLLEALIVALLFAVSRLN